MTGILAFILLVQPLVLTGYFVTKPAALDAAPERNISLAQEPGIRLDSEDLTDHVPILINGTDDFVGQGWPGSGSEVDPFIIEALNITYDVGKVAIHITNTDAYFIIRDCYVNQMSNEVGIAFLNVSNGLVEYCTIMSAGRGIEAFDTAGTKIMHCDVLANQIAVFVYASSESEVSWNRMNSTTHRALTCSYCTDLTLSHNVLAGNNPSYYTAVVRYSNHTTVTDEFSTGLLAGYAFEFDIDVEINNVAVPHENQGYGIRLYTVEGASIAASEAHGTSRPGLQIYKCNATSVTDSTFGSQADIGIEIDWSNHTTLSSCNVVSSGEQGVVVSDSWETTITGLTLTDAEASGILVVNSPHSEITDSSISNTTYFGIEITDSNRTLLSGITIDSIVASGIYANYSYPVDIVGSSISNAGAFGIALDHCENSTITSNSISDSGAYAIWVVVSPRCFIDMNTITGTTHSGIYVMQCPDANINDNDISMASSQGILALNSPRTTIANNWVNGSQTYGINMHGLHNSTVSGNTVEGGGEAFYMSSSMNVEVAANTLSGTGLEAVHVMGSTNITFVDNSIDFPSEQGIFLHGITDSHFRDNTLTGCGFVFELHLIDTYEHEFSGNTVNGKPLYYAWNGSSIDLNGDDYGQILLMNSTDCTVTGGDFDSASVPIAGYGTHNLLIQDAHFSNNLAAYIGYLAENVTIQDCDSDGSDSRWGIATFSVTNINITGTTVADCYESNGVGIRLFTTTNVRISQCSVTNSHYGVYAHDGSGMFLTSCDFKDLNSYGVFLDNFNNDIVQESTFTNASVGVFVFSSDNVSISDSNFSYCTDRAVYLLWSDWVNVTYNKIEDNGYGVYVEGGANIFILNNSIRWNSEYGVYVSSGINVSVYYNVFVMNLEGNGYDASVRNWDDNVSMGNYWYPFSGAPVIIGNAQDRYPQGFLPTTPIINQPQDMSYAEGSTGNTITWYPVDDNLRNWEVEINSEYWAGDAWNYTSIIVNIDGLPYGTHTLVITVWDIHENYVTDTVNIHVYDATPPTISSAPDREAFVGATGQTVTWTVDDLNPDHYVLYVDDIESETGSWTSGVLEVGIDDLSEGLRILRMVIYDVDGNMAEDTLRVLVINDDISPTIDSPADIVYVEGTVGNTITWTPSDQYPASFEVMENSTLYASGSWGGGKVVVNLDGLDPGTYEFAITVSDKSGNTATDTVVVTVVAAVPTATPPPPDIVPLLLIAGVVGVIVVVGALIWYIRKRRPS